MITDRYGRPISDLGNGVYSVEGLSVDTRGGTIDDAIRTFDAMQPSWWLPSEEPDAP